MRGINRVTIAGNVQERVVYNLTNNGVQACSFFVASDRRAGSSTITTRVKINAYGEGLVGVCKARLNRGVYAIVEGELMNRDGDGGELLEVRVRDLIIVDREDKE